MTLAACGVSARKEFPKDLRMNTIIHPVTVMAILSVVGPSVRHRPELTAEARGLDDTERFLATARDDSEQGMTSK
jgi:hypothetical protein